MNIENLLAPDDPRLEMPFLEPKNLPYKIVESLLVNKHCIASKLHM